MNYISDLALDLGRFELDNELESGMERVQRASVQLARERFQNCEIDQETTKVAVALAS